MDVSLPLGLVAHDNREIYIKLNIIKIRPSTPLAESRAAPLFKPGMDPQILLDRLRPARNRGGGPSIRQDYQPKPAYSSLLHEISSWPERAR